VTVESTGLAPPAGASESPTPRLTPIFRRVAVTNGAVLLVACVVVGVVLAPKGLSRFAISEALVVGAAVIVLAVVNFVLLRRALEPLRRLSEFAGGVDLLRPGQRLEIEPGTTEVAKLTGAVNQMLARLEHEQQANTRRALAAQEAERRRIAKELHDEVGQTLTALLLELDQAARLAPPELRGQLRDSREQARSSLEDVRRIAVELRPEALDDLGLRSALIALCDRFSQTTGLQIERDIDSKLPRLTDEEELVIYRVTQEALTNVARHADSATARVSLLRTQSGVSLQVADDGHGFGNASPGSGLQGMRERASLIGAYLSIGQDVGGGVIVRLDLGPDGVED
jgi:two-component system, NarL family, sensor histidine kinase UhpB